MARILMALFLCVTGFAPAGAEEFTVGSWHGSAYFDDETGELTHCSISTEFGNGDTLVFGITRHDEFVLSVSNPQWQLQKGERYPIHLRVDRHDLGRYQAEARLDFGVYVYFSYSEDLIRLLRRGRILYFETSTGTLSYKLTGTSAALPRLQKCANRGLPSKQTARNPFSSGQKSTSSQNPFAGSDGSSNSDEGGIVNGVTRMLREAGLNDYRLVPDAYRPDYLSDAGYVWTNGTVIGATFMEEIGKLDFGVASSLVLSDYENSCDGEFIYGTRTNTLSDDAGTHRVLAICTTDGEDIVMYFIFMEVDDSVLTVLHIADESAGVAAREADEGMSRYFLGY